MDVYSRLMEIIGEDFTSNRQEELYLYSRDMGAQHPRKVDYVVLPRTVEEVQSIVRLANEENVPITPMGGGFTLSALAVPVKGGILLDMRRMDKIIEVNELSRYAVIEAGVNEGALRGYLEKHHPNLQHSTPEAPPTVTITGNALIHGHGHITPRYGINSEMINGLEVVLPTGEVCKVGSCSVSPYWFHKGPLPDLLGLFIGWLGTTGIVTKLSFQLFPKPKYRDVFLFVTDNIDILPDVLFQVTQLDFLDNFFVWGQEKPDWMNHVNFILILSGQSEEEFKLKKKAYRELFTKYEDVVCVEDIEPALKERFLGVPPFAATSADFKKGGGYEYTGAILPVEKATEAWKKAVEVAHKYGMLYSAGAQSLGQHSIMSGFGCSFNRADEEDMERTRQAIDEADRVTLEMGGMIWRPEVAAQKMMMEKMDPNTVELMRKIKKTLDPNGIMNPGNWGD